MKKNLFRVFMLCGIAMIFLSSCRTPSSQSYYPLQTECINVRFDGSQTLKAFGMGRNRFFAVAQAKKNAVHDVIFKGISSGSGECQVKPILLEVNAEEKYRSYFNTFFTDQGILHNKGNYTQFVTLQDERLVKRVFRKSVSANIDHDVYSVIVRVLHEELRQQLIEDGILKQ